MAYESGALDATFAAAAGDDPALLAELRQAFVESLEHHDGLLLAPDEAQKALAGGAGVLVLPVEAGLAAGFERIDLNHAWAGVLAMHGRLVERIAELPPDCDPVSGLLRIALQGRVPKRVLPEAVLTEERWALVRTRHQLAALDPGWIQRHAAASAWRAPGKALVCLVVC